MGGRCASTLQIAPAARSGLGPAGERACGLWRGGVAWCGVARAVALGQGGRSGSGTAELCLHSPFANALAGISGDFFLYSAEKIEVG